MLIVLIGKSGSGKDAILNFLTEYLKYNKVIVYTTRPKREYEVDGKDYHFISDEEFNKFMDSNKFVEYSFFNNWWYGTLREDVENTEFPIIICNPVSINDLKNNFDCKIIYIKAEDKIRYIRQISRGDDIIEIGLRTEREKVMYQKIEDNVDFITDNSTDDLSIVIQDILEYLAK